MGRTLSALTGYLRHGVVAWFRNPRQAMRFWRQVTGVGLSYAPTNLPKRELAAVLPGAESLPVTLENYVPRYGQPVPAEIVTVCQIVRFLSPQTIFEIGTFEGETTVHMAANSTARIWTLDLPPTQGRKGCHPDDPGWRIRETSYGERCIQLLGDSRTFDFGEWRGRMDFVFVDAGHDYENVRSDSLRAMELISEQGAIVWHDYAPYELGVVRALDELNEQLFHIEGTSLAVRPPSGAPNLHHGPTRAG